jgi:hypothetical protein
MASARSSGPSFVWQGNRLGRPSLPPSVVRLRTFGVSLVSSYLHGATTTSTRWVLEVRVSGCRHRPTQRADEVYCNAIRNCGWAEKDLFEAVANLSDLDPVAARGVVNRSPVPSAARCLGRARERSGPGIRPQPRKPWRCRRRCQRPPSAITCT